jgi:Na+-driven multidrug efflux pump
LLADLYWVGHLGKEAIAAVGVAGNITMIVLALTQMLGVGTTTLIAQATGRKDQVRAEPTPLLIFGIGPWPKLGVTGAALATFISILVADVLMVIYFEKKYHYLRFRFPLFRPRTKIWSGMLRIGVPAGAEFMLLFVYILLVYAIIRGFGPAAQAGFGIGARVMQALFLPVVALSFAVSPVVGQNFGGRRADRVRHSVYTAIGVASLMMLVLTLIAFLVPGTLIRIFSRDPRVIVFGSEYLRIVSVNFVSAGVVFCNFQRFSGNRQHATTAGYLDDTAGPVRSAGDLHLANARV